LRHLPLKEYLEVPFYLPQSLDEAVCHATDVSKRTPEYQAAHDKFNTYYKAHDNARKFLLEVENMAAMWKRSECDAMTCSGR